MKKTNSNNRKTHVLLILDGWGQGEDHADNAIAKGNTPNWDRFLKQYPNAVLSGSGLDVGLPEGQMGNSEVGHMNIGAGRIVYQDLTRINQSMQHSGFKDNPVLVNAMAQTDANQTIHLMGLISEGGVHSHEQHLFTLLDLYQYTYKDAQTAPKLRLHLFLDGRDTPPQSATNSLKRLENKLTLLREIGLCAEVVSLCGRFYAMDRDKRWERIQKAFACMTQGNAEYLAETTISALEAAYQRGETDEFVAPTRIQTKTTAQTTKKKAANQNQARLIADGDTLICFNFRADRARQISQAFCQADFTEFEHNPRPKLARFVSMTRYAEEIPSTCAFEPMNLSNTLGSCLAHLGKRQLRIAETEKYAHVTFFFNGGVETPFAGESRILIPSPKVKTYDLAPEMSLPQLTESLCEAIESKAYDLIVCNIANGDMVGHTGNFDAALEAVAAVDKALGQIEASLNQVKGQCLITADHGNIEQMRDANSQQPHTAHTCNPIPLIYIGAKAKGVRNGILSDLAPTLMTLMKLPTPEEMTGRSLVDL